MALLATLFYSLSRFSRLLEFLDVTTPADVMLTIPRAPCAP